MARILVIDDDASLLQMMSLMLKRAGHEPILASDGREGIDIAREQLPDLAVIDIMMPDITGHEVCRIMRQDPTTTDIPLLVLTALSQHDQREIAVEAGADEFVTKPVTRDDLVGRVEELLRTGPRNYPMPPIDPREAAARTRQEAPPPEPVAEVLEEEEQGPTIEQGTTCQSAPLQGVTVVMGLSSGVGATTLAVNLGLTLAEAQRACIVDLHHADGRAAIQLRMVPPRATWEDLLNIEPGGDKRQVGGALTFDRQRNIGLLAAPLQSPTELLTSEQLEYILSVLTEAFPAIVISLPSEINDMTYTALCLAQQVTLIVGEDPTNLLSARERLYHLESFELPGRVRVVLNRTRPHGVAYEEAMQTVNRPFVANIPYEPAQVEAVTNGTPLIHSQPDSLFAQVVRQLAQQL